MEKEFSFYIHHDGAKVLCSIKVNDDDVYDVYFDDVKVTQLRYDHHGKWYQSGGDELPYETILAIGDGIDSHLLTHGL